MLSLIKDIFTSDSTLLKAGIAGVDKSVLTEEEKRDWFISVMKAYEPFKLAQRLLAMTFCPAYMIAWLITWGLSFVMDVTKQEALLDGPISIIVGVIITFYFGGGFLESRGRAKSLEVTK